MAENPAPPVPAATEAQQQEAYTLARGLLYRYAAAVLMSLHEDKDNTPVPESILYMGLGMNLTRYEVVRDAMTTNGLINVRHFAVTLTAKGIELAAKIKAAAGVTNL